MNQTNYTVAIRGGDVLDGLGGPPRRADLAIEAGRTTVLTGGQTVRAARTIDATGCYVVPGFIDIHGHSDLQSLVYPDAASRVATGVTTECNGNCGYGAFPMAGEVLQRRQAEYGPAELAIDWSDAAGYFRRAEETGCSINRVTLIGHGNVRGCVVGYGKTRAGKNQLQRMCRIVDEAMAAGCAGLGSGLTYPPGMWANATELTALCRVVANHNGIYTSHIRSEGDRLLESVSEFLDILRRSGCRGQLSHVKTSEPRNWHKLEKVGQMLRDARTAGVVVHADRYPYIASATDLGTIVLPREAMAGTTDEVLARLADRSARGQIIAAIAGQKGEHLPQWLEAVVVSAVGGSDLQHCVGKNLRQIAEAMDMPDPLEAAIKLLHDDRLAPQGIHFSMSLENLREVYAWPFVAMGSDSSLRDHFGPTEGSRPHPRAYGSPSRFIDLVVRQWGLLDWPEAIRRMTSLPASILGLTGRGYLRDGARADMVVLDPNRFADRATFEDPCRSPDGVIATLVNGEIVWQDGRHTGKRPGELLRTSERA